MQFDYRIGFVWPTLDKPFPPFHVVELVGYAIGFTMAMWIGFSVLHLVHTRYRPSFIATFATAILCFILAAHLHTDPRAFYAFYVGILFLLLSIFIGRLRSQ